MNNLEELIGLIENYLENNFQSTKYEFIGIRGKGFKPSGFNPRLLTIGLKSQSLQDHVVDLIFYITYQFKPPFDRQRIMGALDNFDWEKDFSWPTAKVILNSKYEIIDYV